MQNRAIASGRLVHWVQKRANQHLLFWSTSFYVLLTLFAYDKENLERVDWVYTALFHFTLFPPVYLNLLIFIPVFLKRHRFFLYFAVLVLMLLISIYFHQFTFDYLADCLFPGYYFISYYDNWEVARFTGIYLVLTSLLKLSKSWFQVNENQKVLTRLKGEKLDAELRALKAQIDPHFLFNALNTLYSLSIESHPQTPDYILKLSENLRYILYECGEDRVRLERELHFMENYLAIQKIRMADGNQINLVQQNLNPEAKIAPLLFLPIIENIFKHGDTTAPVRIALEMQGGILHFRSGNKLRAAPPIPTEAGGIGLFNVRKRLQNLYPGRHQLETSEKKDEFYVHLQLQL